MRRRLRCSYWEGVSPPVFFCFVFLLLLLLFFVVVFLFCFFWGGGGGELEWELEGGKLPPMVSHTYVN